MRIIRGSKRLKCFLLLFFISSICSFDALCQEYPEQDFPENPIEKKGWSLIMNDEFDKQNLDESTWIPYYFRHRTTDRNAKASYKIENGNLILQIDSLGNKVSGIQTLERIDLHKKGNRTDIATKINFSQKYGHFEIRAKTQAGSGHCSTFWLIGVQNDSTESAEIDILEQPGNLGSNGMLFNLHNCKDTSLQTYKLPQAQSWNNKLKLNKNLTTTFNIYALEWNENEIMFYFNNQLIKKIESSPKYKMGIILSLYEGNSWWGQLDKSIKYPKQFIIDYLRVYERKK